MNDWRGFTKKFTGSMKLIAPLPYCFWIISVTKKWLAYWASRSLMSASGSIVLKNILSQNQKNMITMEFDEMKKIWDSQNNEPLYAINEKALYNRILSKKKQAHHIT